MPTREVKALANRHSRYTQRLAAATTDRGAFWAAAGWLLSEAIRTRRVKEVTGVLLRLVTAIRDGTPVTDRVFDSNGGVEKLGGDSPRGSTRDARARLAATDGYVNCGCGGRS